jgi:hypothetical protein
VKFPVHSPPPFLSSLVIVISSQRKCQPVIFLSLTPFLYKSGVFSHAFFIFGKYDGNVDLLLGDVGALDSFLVT